MDIKHKYDKILLSKNANRLFIVSCISIIFFQIMWVQTVLGNSMYLMLSQILVRTITKD